MNIKQLLLKLPDELLSDLVSGLNLPIAQDKEAQVNMTLIPYLRRHDKEAGNRLLLDIEQNLKGYELRRLIHVFRIRTNKDPTFDDIRENLEELPHLSNEIGEEHLEDAVFEIEPDIIEPIDDVEENVTTSALPIQPKKLIAVFRSMKYTLGQAIADLVDNSLDSGATKIHVEYELDEEQATRYVIVSDNGKGMTAKELEQGLTLGAEREYKDTDTGKFGIGLKLSSLSQAADVTLFTQIEEEEDYNLRRISYTHIVRTNELELLHSAKKGAHVERALDLLPTKGTSVLLEEMDRRPLNLRRQEVINSFKNDQLKLKYFLAMVFHRYIEGNTTSYNAGRQIKLFVNGEEMEPLDPLMKSQEGGENGTKIVENWVPHDFDYERPQIHVRSQFCVTPNREHLDSDIKEKIEYVTKSPKNQQGLYYYRKDRLISFGGWQGVLKKTYDGPLIEHASLGLAKVAIDIPIQQGIDEEFGLTPTKTDYDPPEEFLLKLSKMLHAPSFAWMVNDESSSFINFAKKRYEKAKGTPRKSSTTTGTRRRRTPTPLTSVNIESYHSESDEPITTSKRDGVLRITINKSHPLYRKVIEKLRESIDE